jgi:gliding motility-associated lipoprotein GldH
MNKKLPKLMWLGYLKTSNLPGFDLFNSKANFIALTHALRYNPLQAVFVTFRHTDMSKQSIFVYLSIVLITMSCTHVYKEYDKESFSTYSWDDGQEISFNPTIEDISKTYQLSLGVRHHFALNLATFNVKIKIISPSGKESSSDYKLAIKDSSNKNIGSCAGDICDLETIVIDNLKFDETGEYTFLISHNEGGYRIPGILELGLIIDEKD